MSHSHRATGHRTDSTCAALRWLAGLIICLSSFASESEVALATLSRTEPDQNSGGLFLPLVAYSPAPANPNPEIPPDPATIAPVLDASTATDFATATAFLYSGPNSPQIGVAPGAINPARVVVLRGRVNDRAGAALPGVRISLLDHPEWGQTASRMDGQFDIAANGGGALVVHYEKNGYLPVQRRIETPWRDFVWLPDVVMTELDSAVAVIDLSANAGMQVARSSVVSDDDGSRQTTLLFPQATTAQMVLPDGTVQDLGFLSVRATEFTVGERGPQAMPAQLPPRSGYTYAVEFSVDEALAAGAVDVQFSQPVYNYVENFLDFPIGTAVPTGYYDRGRARWVPAPDGRVIKVLSIINGRAVLDSTGNNLPDNGAELGVSDAERGQLAQLYAPGQSLWRVPISHFTPWDHNWPYGPPDDAQPPQQPFPAPDHPEEDPCEQEGSIIECQNQIVGERIALVGVPYTLNYRSSRHPGYLAAQVLDIALSGAQVPASLSRIELNAYIAGQHIERTFPPTPNQLFTLNWDGMDAYARRPQGAQALSIELAYIYPALYREGTAEFDRSFARFGGARVLGDRARQEIAIRQRWHDQVRLDFTVWDARAMGLGGWTISPHHWLDPEEGLLFLGDGSLRRIDQAPLLIDTVAGSGEQALTVDELGLDGPGLAANLGRIDDIVLGPDGSIYINAFSAARILHVAPDGIITSFAGGGDTLPTDGTPAASLNLGGLGHMALDRLGRVYLMVGNFVGRIGPDGIFRVVAGDGQACLGNPCGDGGPATEAQFDQGAIALSPEGDLYIADGARIRRVGADGIVTTVVGQSGQACLPANRPCGDGGPASAALLRIPSGIAFSQEGDIYIADSGTHSVRHISPSGIITTVAGSWTSGFSGDGGQATAARLDDPSDVAIGPSGELLIADQGNYAIRQVRSDGIISTFAGMGRQPGHSGDKGAAKLARLSGILEIDVGADGKLYIADGGNYRIRKVSPQLAALLGTELIIASEDGRQLYIFDAHGRHLRTLHAWTGALLHQFDYTHSGHLATVTDGNSNITTIERDANGNPTAITAPFGQRTTLSLDADGYLGGITNPAGETHTFTYQDGVASGKAGLLATYTDPRNQQTRMSYDELGRLVRTEDATGATLTLSRVESGHGYTVTVSQAGERSTTYGVDERANGDFHWITVLPGGAQSTMVIGVDGSRHITKSSGATIVSRLAANPRWGLQSPLVSSLQVTTPDNLLYTRRHTQTVQLADPADLLSLHTVTDTFAVNQHTYTSVYKATDRTVTSSTPARRQNSVVLDEQGRVQSVAIPDQATQQLTYDERGRLATVTWGSGNTARMLTLRHDELGFLEEVTDPLQRTIQLRRDASGRVTELRYPDGRIARWGYDAAGNLTSVTPPGQPAHTFTYTERDQVATYRAPSLGGVEPETRYTYTPAGQLDQVARPGGVMLDLGYDTAGRLVSLSLERGEVRFVYDPSSGLVESVTAPDGGQIEYGYDGDLVTSFTWTGLVVGSVEGTYTNDFRLASQSVNGGQTVAFAYDPDGLLIAGGDLVLAYDSQNGLLDTTSLGNVSDEWTYNEFGEVSVYEARYNESALYSVTYTRDNLGRVLSKTEQIGGATSTFAYSYDLAGNLATIGENGGPALIFTYDSNGNRLSQGGFGGDFSGSYDAQDRLLEYGAASYTYSATGDLHTKMEGGQTTTYTYDELGNLTQVSLPDGTEIEYLIDGQNRRIGKRVDGNLVQGFLYQDPINPVAQLDGEGALVSRFVYGARGHVPVYMVRDGAIYRILSDALGSPRLVVDVATGVAAQRLDYDTFGNIILDSNPGFQPFGFAGGLYDDQTGLTRFGFRDYDATSGRWTTKDPAQFVGGMNFYRYVHNDPVNYIDPLGLAKPTKPSDIVERLPNNIVDPANVPDPSEDITQIQPVRTPGTAPSLGDVVPDAWDFDPQNPDNVDTEPMICPAPDNSNKKRRFQDLEEACAASGAGSDACLLLQNDPLGPIFAPIPALGPIPLPSAPTLPVRIPIRFPTPIFGIP